MSETLRLLMDTGLAAVDPMLCVPQCLPAPPRGRTVVIGAGKAAAKMARATELHFKGQLSGLVITRFGHSVHCEKIEVVEAGHPVPEQSGLDASLRMMSLVADLTRDDLVIYLVSGGGSSLFDVPAEGVPFEDVQSVNRQMLRSGLPINEMNCVRKHLSAVKGGRLVPYVGKAKLVTIAISDVPYDDPSTIASGATVTDDTTRQMALSFMEKYGLDIPPTIRRHLESETAETPKPGDPAFANSEFRIAACAADMIAAVKSKAKQLGFNVVDLGADVEGEAQRVGLEHAARAIAEVDKSRSSATPTLIVSGGETTVTVKGKNGRGGRNTEFLLSFAIGINDHPEIFALAIDSDGIDGSEDNAGAFIAPGILDKASRKEIDPQTFLHANNSYEFFERMGSLINTGPTCTNVNDLRLIACARNLLRG